MEKLATTRYIGSSVIIPVNILNEVAQIQRTGITPNELLLVLCKICNDNNICAISPDDIKRRRSKYNTSSPEGIIKNIYGFLLYAAYRVKFKDMAIIFCFEDGSPRTRGALLHHVKTTIKLLSVVDKDEQFKKIYTTIIRQLCS